MLLWTASCHTINWLTWQAGKSWEFTDCIRRRQKCYQKSRGWHKWPNCTAGFREQGGEQEIRRSSYEWGGDLATFWPPPSPGGITKYMFALLLAVSGLWLNLPSIRHEQDKQSSARRELENLKKNSKFGHIFNSYLFTNIMTRQHNLAKHWVSLKIENSF